MSKVGDLWDLRQAQGDRYKFIIQKDIHSPGDVYLQAKLIVTIYLYSTDLLFSW